MDEDRKLTHLLSRQPLVILEIVLPDIDERLALEVGHGDASRLGNFPVLIAVGVRLGLARRSERRPATAFASLAASLLNLPVTASVVLVSAVAASTAAAAAGGFAFLAGECWHGCVRENLSLPVDLRRRRGQRAGSVGAVYGLPVECTDCLWTVVAWIDRRIKCTEPCWL